MQRGPPAKSATPWRGEVGPDRPPAGGENRFAAAPAGHSFPGGIRFDVIPPRIPGASAIVLVAAGVLSASTARAGDPFQPGERWRVPAPVAAPAVPRSLSLAAGGGVVFTASNGPTPGFDVLSGYATGTGARRFHLDAPVGATGSMAVAACESADRLFALVQVPSPDAVHRATLVTRHSAFAAAQTGSLQAAWTFDSGVRANGPARFAVDEAGTRVAVAAWDGPTPQARLDVLDASNGASLAHAWIPASGLQDVVLSADGTCVAVACGLDVHVFDGACQPLHVETLASAPGTLSVSADGARVAYGGARVGVLARVGGSYAPLAEVLGGPGEIAARVALSGDGGTLAIGWWHGSTSAVRFEVRDVGAAAPRFEVALPGGANGLSNAVEAVRVTRDGARAALGAWGDGTGAADLLVWDRATNALVLAEDLPGSVFALALDASGTRVVVGMKATHANVFSGTGEFRLYETGERELHVASPATPGTAMLLAGRHPGATGAIFLSGALAPQPVFVPGASGVLFLDRVGVGVRRLATDATGRADVAWAIPNDSASIGTWRHLQVAFRVGGGLVLGPTVLDVPVY